MTLRLVIGIDPGVLGATVALCDGEPWMIEDMPVITHSKTGVSTTNHVMLAERLATYRRMHPGADVFAAVERQMALPNEAPQRSLKTGAGFGMILGVLAGLSINHCVTSSQAWKKHHDLIGKEKDAARLMALRRFPEKAGLKLQRKRDNGRADALMIAVWAHETEAWI